MATIIMLAVILLMIVAQYGSLFNIKDQLYHLNAKVDNIRSMDKPNKDLTNQFLDNSNMIRVVNNNWIDTIQSYDLDCSRLASIITEHKEEVVEKIKLSSEFAEYIHMVVPMTNPVVDGIVNVADKNDHLLLSMPEEIDGCSFNVVEVPIQVYVVLRDYLTFARNNGYKTSEDYILRITKECKLSTFDK